METLAWMDQEDRSDVVRRWQVQAGIIDADHSGYGSDVDSIGEDEFRADIGAPRRPKEK